MTSPEIGAAFESFRAALITVSGEAHADMAALVSGLPIDALKWMPVPAAPHISGITLHILEVEDYLARVLNGEDIPWTGPLGSSNALVMPANELVARIAATDQGLIAAMRAVAPERLVLPQPGEDRTIGEMLVEDLAHSSLHLGHLQLTRQLMALTLKSLTLPEYVHWA